MLALDYTYITNNIWAVVDILKSIDVGSFFTGYHYSLWQLFISLGFSYCFIDWTFSIFGQPVHTFETDMFDVKNANVHSQEYYDSVY